MAIKIMRQRRMYSAEVTPPHGSWKSPAPMRSNDLAKRLWAIGCDPADVWNAFKEVGITSSVYYEAADEISPPLKTALEGKRTVPPQERYVESWLTCTLFELGSPQYLEDVIQVADGINHLIPNRDEIAWAFLRIKARGWLVEEDDKYGLSDEGRRTLEAISKAGGLYDWTDRVEEWILAHPAPGFEHSEYKERQKEWWVK